MAATVETFANQPSTTVSAGGTTAPVSGTQETWTASSSASFPAANSGASPPTQFHVADTASGKTSEIIAVTNVSGTTWTVTRGAESTTPVAHSAGFTVVQVVTAGFLGGIPVNPMTTSGDLIYGGASGAETRLAGDTSNTRKFLREQSSGGVAQPPAWDTLQSGDIPNNAANTSGTAAGLSATLAIGSGGTGQVTQQTALDALAGAQTANQVLRGNGTHVQLAALQASDVPGFDGVTVTGTPSAGMVPTATGSSAATWQAVGVQSLTFTYGSSGAVPSSGTFTAGTVAVDQNDIMRVCTVSGTPGTWRRVGQEPYEFYVDDYGAKGDGVEVLVTVSTSSAQITAASSVFTSTAVDGGKNIMICGAGGAIPGGPLIDTIASVQSATQATLTSGAPAGPSSSGLAAVFSSDDRVAIDNCQTAARAYALAHNYFAKVIYSDKIYGLGATMFQSQQGVSGALLTYNTQVRLPVPADQTGESGKLEVQQIGAGAGGHCQFWTSTSLNAPGTALVSYSVGPNSTPDPTFGQQSIMGGPGGGSGTIGADNGFFNAKAVVKGITFVQPGWSNSIGLDCQWIAAIDWDGLTSTAFAPSTNLGGGVNPYSQWIFAPFWLNNKIGAGFRLPNQANNDELLTSSLCVQGLNTGILSGADHVIINRLSVNSVDVTLKLVPGANAHALNIYQASCENINAFIITDGGSSAKVECDITFDGENTVISGNDVKDTGNELYGTLKWSDQFRTAGGIANVVAPAVSGAANLEIINNSLPRTVQGAPTYTLGTAFQNPWWKQTTITLAGGTVTGISIGPTSGSLTSLGITSGTFRLPSGWWLNIAGSVKPTTFIAVTD